MKMSFFDWQNILIFEAYAELKNIIGKRMTKKNFIKMLFDG